MPMHLNSLTPMRISGTPRSFLNLDSRCPTPIEAFVIGGDLDSPLPITGRVGFDEHDVLVISCRPQLLTEAFRSAVRASGVSCSIQVATPSDAICAIRTMGHHGEQLVHGYRSS
jgi:hypothetical protein